MLNWVIDKYITKKNMEQMSMKANGLNIGLHWNRSQQQLKLHCSNTMLSDVFIQYFLLLQSQEHNYWTKSKNTQKCLTLKLNTNKKKLF